MARIREFLLLLVLAVLMNFKHKNRTLTDTNTVWKVKIFRGDHYIQHTPRSWFSMRACLHPCKPEMYTCIKTLSYRLSCPQISDVFLIKGLSDIHALCQQAVRSNQQGKQCDCDQWTHRKCTNITIWEDKTNQMGRLGKSDNRIFSVIHVKWDFQTFLIHILKATEPHAPFHNNTVHCASVPGNMDSSYLSLDSDFDIFDQNVVFVHH